MQLHSQDGTPDGHQGYEDPKTGVEWLRHPALDSRRIDEFTERFLTLSVVMWAWMRSHKPHPTQIE